MAKIGKIGLTFYKRLVLCMDFSNIIQIKENNISHILKKYGVF